MRYLILSLLAASPALAADCVSVNHNPAYTVHSELLEDGVWKGFYAVEIHRRDDRIQAIGQGTDAPGGLKIPFFEVNQNDELRVRTGEYLSINGASSLLSLQDDAKVPLSCK
jgi:hypothetical protein